VDGRVSVGGVLFYWDELARHTGGKVCIRLPKYRCRSAIPASSTKGELIGIARPAPVDALLDPAGAGEAAWRK
jgi:hypothetical protein